MKEESNSLCIIKTHRLRKNILKTAIDTSSLFRIES